MFLSIIVPVYNTEEYLDECLQSMLHQDISRDDYEIICVNDGSTDGSLDLLRRYEQEYPCVKVIDQENGGVCKARNAGLLAAQGDYVWYVDSDDYIQPDCLGQLKEKSESGKYDRIIIGQQCFVDPQDDSTVSRRMFNDNAPWFDSVVSRSLLKRTFLLKNDLIFRYPHLKYGEDALMVYEIKRHMPFTLHLDVVVYLYRTRPNSAVTATGAQGNYSQLRSNLAEAQILKDYFERKDGILTAETANRFMSFLWGALYRMSLMPAKDAAPYLRELKTNGLYPYKRPKECTLVKCPEVKRDDIIGKLFDILYTNLGSPWGYRGMRLVHFLFHIKQRIAA